MLPTVNDLEVTTHLQFRDQRGVLVPLDISQSVPFPVVRLFWVFDVPPGASRGAHAHKACHQYYICASGSVQVESYDAQTTRTITLAAGSGLHETLAAFRRASSAFSLVSRSAIRHGAVKFQARYGARSTLSQASYFNPKCPVLQYRAGMPAKCPRQRAWINDAHGAAIGRAL